MKNKEDKNLPGYPHYPVSEDITEPDNNTGRALKADMNQGPATEDAIVDDAENEADIVPGTDADVTPEDLQLLNAAEQNMDTTDDINLLHAQLDEYDTDGDPLNESDSANDLSGAGLDVPGSAADDADEAIGEEDEENNYYSLGGDLHEGQEENKGE